MRGQMSARCFCEFAIDIGLYGRIMITIPLCGSLDLFFSPLCSFPFSVAFSEPRIG